MSRQVRYRVAAVVLSGLIFGAPLLANGTASAEQLDPNDRRVSFTNSGVLGLTCESKPSVESMTVPADSVVQVRNRTGHDAQLRLGGAPKGMIPENGSAEVLFRRGTTSVMLTPECDHGNDVVPMTITATPSPGYTKPDPGAAAPGGGAATLSQPPGAGSPTRTRAGSAKTGQVSSAKRPVRGGPQPSRPGVRKLSAARPQAAASNAAEAPGAMPQGAAGQRLRPKPLAGTGAVGAPAFVGMPPGKPLSKSTTAAAEAPLSNSVPPASESAAVPAPETAEPSGVAGTEPVAVGTIREGRPIGLLGLIAMVCVLGVSIATIRAIVSQRASRTNMA
ncbi:hypothetical protein AB0F72_03055 [Actinoplanes sp. NPDC023936]|uniref:hypothetical protein n=1 Tax=Actinoplanes sp. NPDC023936 TaxID=3154910 RepID=UPI00340E3095